MKKTIEITKCDDCPHFHLGRPGDITNRETCFFTHTTRPIAYDLATKTFPIPEWCPLENKEQPIADWVRYFIGIAEQVKLKSKDQSTQIGAVIVGKDKEIRSTGYNSFPRGLNDDLPERQERPIKYYYIEHAERNAIYNAAKVGIPLDGCAIFLTSGLPCADCARAIINSGIIRVYCKSVCPTKNKDKWLESQAVALEMLKECGVEVIFYD